MGSSFDHHFVAIIGIISLLLGVGLVSSGNTVLAQYGASSEATNRTSAQLAECERLGLDPEDCTENNILTKQRLLQAQQVPAQQAGEEVILLTATSVGNQTGQHFDARIVWTPADLGQPNSFHIEIFDANQLEPRDPLAVRYDIKIYKGDRYLRPAEPTGNEAVQNEDFSHDYTFVFLEGGSYILAIEEIGHEGENIRIPIQVTPELPMAAGLSIVLVGAIIAVVILGRVRFSQKPRLG
jgi:hypothetical protein